MALKYLESTNPGSTNFWFHLDKFRNISASLSSFESENYHIFYLKELFFRITWETMDIRNQEKKRKKKEIKRVFLPCWYPSCVILIEQNTYRFIQIQTFTWIFPCIWSLSCHNFSKVTITRKSKTEWFRDADWINCKVLWSYPGETVSLTNLSKTRTCPFIRSENIFES